MSDSSDASGSDKESVKVHKTAVTKKQNHGVILLPTITKHVAIVKAHPTYKEMVNTAIKELNDRRGSALPSIKKYIAANFGQTQSSSAVHIRKYLKKAVEEKTLIQTHGVGANGRFKMAINTKVKEKIPKPAKKIAPKDENIKLKKPKKEGKSAKSGKTTDAPKTYKYVLDESKKRVSLAKKRRDSNVAGGDAKKSLPKKKAKKIKGGDEKEIPQGAGKKTAVAKKKVSEEKVVAKKSLKKSSKPDTDNNKNKEAELVKSPITKSKKKLPLTAN